MRAAHSFPRRYGYLALFLWGLAGCGRGVPGEGGDVPPLPTAAPGDQGAPIAYAYRVVHAWPHDRSAFTEGLVYRDGDLLESTGLNGKSTFRDVDLETGRVLKSVSLPREYFGEGLAVIGTRAFQLTWRNQKGFIYDVATFRAEGEFSYEGEGWGLTTDGRWLIMSDGTSRIRFIDPSNFKVVRTIEVTSAGAPVDQLNELEWVKGEIFANVWQTDRVVRIDPSTGAVRGIVDFSGLLDSGDRGPDTDVLNGIAYDATRDRLYVTGKCWPKLFEVRLIRKP